MSADIHSKQVSRRKFLQYSGVSGAAFLLGMYFNADAKENPLFSVGESEPSEIEMFAWVRIDTSGKITCISHRAEMGQGAYHSLAQIIAEELEADLATVNIEFAQGDPKKFGSQITGGSSTIRGSYKNLLKLSATARHMLVAAAAAKWNVPATECYAQLGHVHHKPSGRKVHYGEVAVDASKMKAPANVVLKKPSEYKLIRKPLLRRDTPLKTNGTAIFGLDKRVPGMLFAAVERNPRLRGKIKSFDASAAMKVHGVQKVFPVTMKVFDTDREGVAVVATSTWAALQGKKALRVQWDDAGFEHLDTEEIFTRARQALHTQHGITFLKQGEAESSLQKAPGKLDVVYETPYQYHACMEPLNCVAHYQSNKIEVWGPIQAPDWVQQDLVDKFKLPPENVIVNMTFLGGGFGRKAFLDYPHEAVLISKEIGVPVQVVWTREDDATQGPFRPGMCYRFEGALEPSGKINAIKVRLAGQNLGHWMGPYNGKPNDSATEGFPKPYTKSVKNLTVSDIPFETPIPVMWWRSVYASTNGFAYESFIDELAAAAGKDPLAFRKQHLPDERCHKLLDQVAAMSGWNTRGKAKGYGVAITECFDSTVAQVVKVSRKSNGAIGIDNVWAAIDCGWYVNPDIIKAQVEGSIIMGLGAATMHETTFTDGKADKDNFYSYELPRITDAPPIDVHVMDNFEDAGGVGEPGLPPFTPALTNAIFDLTGKRIRRLPFKMNEV